MFGWPKSEEQREALERVANDRIREDEELARRQLKDTMFENIVKPLRRFTESKHPMGDELYCVEGDYETIRKAIVVLEKNKDRLLW